MMNNFDLIAKIARAYNSELLLNNNSPLKDGTFQKNSDRISFLTLKDEALVIDFKHINVDTVAIYNHSVIQINSNDLINLKNKVYTFAETSKNNDYWNAISDLIGKTI